MSSSIILFVDLCFYFKIDNGRNGSDYGVNTFRYSSSEDPHRIPIVAQKKHHMFGKRYFHENSHGKLLFNLYFNLFSLVIIYNIKTKVWVNIFNQLWY